MISLTGKVLIPIYTPVKPEITDNILDIRINSYFTLKELIRH